MIAQSLSSAPPAEKHILKKSIVVVDDHPVLRLGLTALIESETDLEIVAAVGTSADAVRAIKAKQPDLLIVDITIKGRNGLGLVKDVRATFSGVRMLVLNMRARRLAPAPVVT